jgi:sugar O-acyltransferase (sialic acid O-acetyltransferase NeuD family)
MKRLAIIGSSELAIQIINLASECPEFQIVGYFDDFEEVNTLKNGYLILGSLKDITNSFSGKVFDLLIFGIGYNHLRAKLDIYSKYCSGIPFATVIHPDTIIDKSAEIGEGVVIYPGVIIDKKVRVGSHTVLNLGCCIAHDSHVGMNSFLAPRVVISGFCNIGENCMLGTNATIIDNISIAPCTWIGAGSVVIKNLSETGLYVGNPAKLKKVHDRF